MRPSLFALCFVANASVALSQSTAHDATSHTHDKPTLGTISFPNGGGKSAQEPFLRGVALLHNFEYDRAAQAFRQAQTADPSFALAYWLEALTYSHVVWRTEDLSRSRAVLAKLGVTPSQRLARATSPMDRAFGAAVEAFYVDRPLEQRASAYADSMRHIVSRWPDDQEAAAFASHALMVKGVLNNPGAVRDSLSRDAIALSLRVFKNNQKHPGATHYLIHLYDEPNMAREGLEFARLYDTIAPDAEHALHMPSHIYLQLGMWADVVSSNERSWAASRRAGTPSWHALSWLQYAYLQQGRWEAGRALIDSARAVVPTDRDEGYIDALAIIPRLQFQYAAASSRWTHPISEPPAPRSGAMQDRERGFRLSAGYWRAVDAAQRNEATLGTTAAPFISRADSARAGTLGSSIQGANALLVEALVSRARGDTAGYMSKLEAAAERERQITPFVGPPERLFALEVLGDELTARGKFDEAARAFEQVLRVTPGRSESLFG
ncbi:MAG: hypothetical protein ABIZ91_15760, partial [Gemmatimonadaceae bacterium]